MELPLNRRKADDSYRSMTVGARLGEELLNDKMVEAWPTAMAAPDG
jgi:hypothetical protein